MTGQLDMDLSCAVDGELEGRARATLVDSLLADRELAARWTRYHAFGELMRGTTDGRMTDLVARVRAVIATDPPLARSRILARVIEFPRRHGRSVAGLALAASVAVATVIGVRALSFSPAPAPQLAEAPPQAGALALRESPLVGGRNVSLPSTPTAEPNLLASGTGSRSDGANPSVADALPDAPALPGVTPPALLRDARIDEYLGRHRARMYIGVLPTDFAANPIAAPPAGGSVQ